MFRNAPVLLGQYRPLDSYLHRLDARAKIIPVTLILILALLAKSYLFYVILLVGLLGALLSSRVSVRTLSTNFRPVLILAVITVAYHLVFSGSGTEVLAEILGVKFTTGAVQAASFFALRLVLFISVAFLVTLTSSPSELAEAFARICRPLERLRLPIEDLALILFMAIRFIPVLYEEFIAIRNAQMVRGVDFTGSLVNRLRKTTCIIIPVFVAALQRADDLAVAISTRGYKCAARRTFYSASRFGAGEWLFAALTSFSVVAVYVLTE